MATLLRWDGREETVTPKDPVEGFTCKEMYALIGHGCDMVQLIWLRDGRTMWLDECGKLRPQPAPPNRKATKLLEEAGGIPGDYIIGNVLVCNEGEVK